MTEFRIISRAEWGARYQNGAYVDGQPLILRMPYSETWFHHDVGRALAPSATFEQDAAAVRATEQVGQDRFGQGISYTWLIAPSGRIFEGHSVNRRGAHTAGRNDIARAICWIGNYEIQHLTTEQLRAAAWLLQHNHSTGWCIRVTANGGHRDLKATACPGQHAYTAIPSINQLAAGPDLEEDTMATLDDHEKQLLMHMVRSYVPGQAGLTHPGPVEQLVEGLAADVAGIKARLVTVPGPVPIDYDQLAKALLRNMANPVTEGATQ